MTIMILLPCLFIGALTYMITDDLAAAIVVGSGWSIILLILMFIVAFCVELAGDIRRNRRRKKRQADLAARKERYARERRP